MKIRLLSLLIVMLSVLPLTVNAQILGVDNQKLFTDSLRQEFDRGPYFSLYKDNYINNKKITKIIPCFENFIIHYIRTIISPSELPWAQSRQE